MENLLLFYRDVAFKYASDSSHKLPDAYQNLKERYLILNSSSDMNDVTRLRLCWATIGLLKYGDKSVIHNTIKYLPNLGERHGSLIRLTGQALVYILPLPDKLNDPTGNYIRKYRNELQEWVNENYSQLTWDKNKGQFILEGLDDDESKEQN